MNAISGKMTTVTDRFEELLQGHIGIVLRVVRTYCRHTDDQQDLAQDIKLQLWRAFPKYDESRPFSTWMYRIALNTAISWNRRPGRSNLALDDVPEAAADPANEDLRALHHIIDGLDPMNRALMLLVLEDLSHAEIGEILGISPANVATKVSRLKQRLRDQHRTKEEL